MSHTVGFPILANLGLCYRPEKRQFSPSNFQAGLAGTWPFSSIPGPGVLPPSKLSFKEVPHLVFMLDQMTWDVIFGTKNWWFIGFCLGDESWSQGALHDGH